MFRRYRLVNYTFDHVMMLSKVAVHEPEKVPEWVDTTNFQFMVSIMYKKLRKYHFKCYTI